MKHSTDVKDTALKKILGPGGRSIAAVSREMGLNTRTVYGWVRAAQNGQMSKRGKGGGPNITEKFALVLEARALSEEDLGRWLRTKGLHGDQLKLWEQEIESVLGRDVGPLLHEKEQDIKELRKELRRKDKALAEMAALVILKKKLQTMFGEEEPPI